MIRINLLPEELQRAASTPKGLFFGLAGGVAATLVLGVVMIFMYWNVLSLRDRVESRKIEVDLVKEKAYEVDRINEDIAFYKEREKAIIQIKSHRILWSAKLAKLAELTPSNVWITDITMNTPDVTEYKWEKHKEQTGGRLSLTCYAQGKDPLPIMNFRKALSGEKRFYKDMVELRAQPDNFFGEFLRFLPPSWELVELPGYAEPQANRFQLDMDIRTLIEKPAEPVVADAKAKPARPAKKKGK
ncbi:MAG: hypothetical protein L0Z55_04215 [Planctomycetes bacterium]|nr:hypothetical protein [Planctomycetota bacterium]